MDAVEIHRLTSPGGGCPDSDSSMDDCGVGHLEALQDILTGRRMKCEINNRGTWPRLRIYGPCETGGSDVAETPGRAGTQRPRSRDRKQVRVSREPVRVDLALPVSPARASPEPAQDSPAAKRAIPMSMPMPVTERDVRRAAATIRSWPRYVAAPPGNDAGIPGLPAAEFRVLLGAAARFCRQHPMPAQAQAAAFRRLFILARPAPLGAAGLSSALRDEYHKDHDRTGRSEPGRARRPVVRRDYPDRPGPKPGRSARDC
jgi:hypothetical protein